MLREYSVSVTYIKKDASFSLARHGIRVKANDTFQASADAVKQIVDGNGEVTITEVEVKLYEVRRYFVTVSFTVEDCIVNYINSYNFFVDSRGKAERQAIGFTKKIYGESTEVKIIEITDYKI